MDKIEWRDVRTGNGRDWSAEADGRTTEHGSYQLARKSAKKRLKAASKRQ